MHDDGRPSRSRQQDNPKIHQKKAVHGISRGSSIGVCGNGQTSGGSEMQYENPNGSMEMALGARNRSDCTMGTTGRHMRKQEQSIEEADGG